MVMQRIANPSTPVQFRPQPFFSPDGGIGRHKGLKIPRRKLRAGSSPALGTTHLVMKYELVAASKINENIRKLNLKFNNI